MGSTYTQVFEETFSEGVFEETWVALREEKIVKMMHHFFVQSCIKCIVPLAFLFSCLVE